VSATQFQRPPHHLTLDFPDHPLMVHVDRKRIEQVLRNLLSNAIKYSPQGGTITIQGRGDLSQALIWVRDEGLGIPEQDLERVFERFYRVESADTQSISGVGLGLAVCRGIIKAHGGRIWAESTLGQGSTFYFTLPTEAPAADTEHPKGTSHVSSPATPTDADGHTRGENPSPTHARKKR
jgi:signal transduction histidine kinase